MVSIPFFQNCPHTTQRKILLASFSVFLFLHGMTFSVVVSTLWSYLNRQNSDHWFYGVTLSMHSGSGALTSPIIGHFADVYRQTRYFTMAGSFMCFIGLLIYSLSFSIYCPLIGVAIAGAGGTVNAVLFGDLARITTCKERTKFVALLEGSKLLGFILGPCLNMAEKNCEFDIGKWEIFYGNCSVLSLSITYLVFSLIVFLCHRDLPHPYEAEQYVELKSVKDLDEENEDGDDDVNSGIASFLTMGDPNGRDSLTDDEDDLPEILKHFSSVDEELKPGVFDDLFHAEVIILLWFGFFMAFIISSASTLAPVFVQEQLGWKESGTNFLFIGIGCVILITIILTAIISRCLYDRHILLFSVGLLTCSFPLLFLIAYFEDTTSLTITFVILTSLIAATGTCFIITVRSLLTKVSSEHLKSFNQGILVTVTLCGEFIGPIISAVMFEHFIHFSVLVNVVNFTILIGIITVYKRLKIRSVQREVEVPKD